MKKNIICLLLMTLATTSFSQQTNPAPTLTKQDYLKKGKTQKTIACVMLGGGATLILTGIIIPRGEITNPGCIFCPEYLVDHENDGIKGAFGFAGFLSIIGSIPFFIVSNKNYKRAMSVSFKNETAPIIQKSSFEYRTVPSLTFKVSL